MRNKYFQQHLSEGEVYDWSVIESKLSYRSVSRVSLYCQFETLVCLGEIVLAHCFKTSANRKRMSLFQTLVILVNGNG